MRRVLVPALFAMYAPCFLADYLVNDERSWIGRQTDPFTVAGNGLLHLGRPFAGVLRSLVFNFIGFDARRMMLARFVNWLSLALLASLLLGLLARRSGKPEALLLTLLFFSQLGLMGLFGYSVVTFADAQPALWLSMLALYLHFDVFRGVGGRRWVERGLVWLLFTVALGFGQAYAFFALVPLTHLVLADGERLGPRVRAFLACAAASLLTAAVVVGLAFHTLHARGGVGHAGAERTLGLLGNDPLRFFAAWLNPFTCWSAFEIWTYPLARAAPSELARFSAAAAVLVAWLGLVLFAVAVERRRKDAARQWLTLLPLLAFATFPMVADAPEVVEHRPHLGIVLGGMVLVSGAHALRVLAAVFSAPLVRAGRAVLVAAVVLIAVGAGRSFRRAIVDLRAAELAFLRQQLAGSTPRRVLVVEPRCSERRICLATPCGAWSGALICGAEYDDAARYRYALARRGGPPPPRELELVFVASPPAAPPPGDVVVDWNQFVAGWLRE
jgi:hypothetical protein